jgi:hypothetical protein
LSSLDAPSQFAEQALHVARMKLYLSLISKRRRAGLRCGWDVYEEKYEATVGRIGFGWGRTGGDWSSDYEQEWLVKARAAY